MSPWLEIVSAPGFILIGWIGHRTVSINYRARYVASAKALRIAEGLHDSDPSGKSKIPDRNGWHFTENVYNSATPSSTGSKAAKEFVATKKGQRIVLAKCWLENDSTKARRKAIEIFERI